jgi:hypothetical protein
MIKKRITPDTHSHSITLKCHLTLESHEESDDVVDHKRQCGQSMTAVDPLDAHMMKMWYVSTPFEVVSVNDNTDDDVQERSRPLVAVDFGHAAWVEYRVESRGR